MPIALAAALALVLVASMPSTTGAADYPPKDARYHSYPEMVRHIKEVAAAHPDIVRLFSIGTSHQGRTLWAAEISDNVGTDEGEPEILFDGLHHAREHLSAEQAIDVLDLLAGHYGRSTSLGKRVTKLVDRRRTWVVFMVNPDGLQYDLGGSPYRSWRRNRQPTPGSRSVGTDLNRNYAYRFGCCGGSSGKAGAWNYRGPRAWSAPETRAMRDFVLSRIVEGRQRIRAHISFHTAGQQVLWPYGYTRKDRPNDMTKEDLRAFRALGRKMADLSRYRARQSSDLYLTDGDMIDWMYGRQRIFSFTFELYPRSGTAKQRSYPPDEVIARETKRNRGAILYLLAQAWCPYAAIGADPARLNCGPLFDDFEAGRGWKVDANGTDTATDGRWSRGDPTKGRYQLGSAVSGKQALVTGRKAGRDVDGGRTTIRSPRFRVPDDGKATLRLRYWVGHSASAGAKDGLRVHLVDSGGTRLATLASVSGDGAKRSPSWKSLKRRLPGGLGGKQLQLELVAVDGGRDSVLEVGVDQVRITAD
jgi:murein tripeptide amidase MpaA